MERVVVIAPCMEKKVLIEICLRIRHQWRRIRFFYGCLDIIFMNGPKNNISNSGRTIVGIKKVNMKSSCRSLGKNADK